MRYLRLLPLLLVAGAPACGAEGASPPPVPPPQPAPTIRAPAFGVAPPEPLAERRVIEVKISPATGHRDGDATAGHLDVAIGLSEPPGELADPLSLWLTQSEGAEGGFADAIEEMYARDAEGALTLRARPAAAGDASAGAPHVEWRSDRRPVGPIRIGYRVRLAHGDRDHFHGTRGHAHGFEGTGATFLVLPEAAETYRIRLSWDLASAGEGAIGISTLGADTFGPLRRLREASFMAGRLGSISVDPADGTHFEAAWLGHPAFDPVEALPWLARVRAEGRSFFHDPPGQTFTVLVRAVPGIGPGNRISAPYGGLRLLAGDEMGWGRANRFYLASQIVHRWIGSEAGLRFDGPEHASSWLLGGLSLHYTRELLLRSGLASIDEVAEDLREHPAVLIEPEKPSPPPPPAGAIRIADSTHHHVEAVARRLWGAPIGMLYAAEVDAAVRAKSGGKRSLDDLVLALLARARTGAKPDGILPPLPAGAFRELVAAELGPEATARYDAAAKGEPFAPAPEAFGPCFKREKWTGHQKAEPGAKGKAPPAQRQPQGFVWVRDPRAPATCARRAVR